MCSRDTRPAIPERAAHAATRGARGFTLIELIVVVIVLGIIAAVAAIAIREPLDGYRAAVRRAELVDAADTALRRIGREVRLALPNSVRVTGAGPIYLELLLTKSGGRYRSQPDGTGAGDVLDFGAPDTSFDTLGPMSSLSGQAVAAGDVLVVHNLFALPAVATSNAYTYNQAAYCAAASSANCNASTVTGTAAGALANETRISFASRQFPLSSPGNRFFVVSGPVTYVCNPGAVDANGDGTGTLTRVSGYTIGLTQPTGTYTGSPATAILAQNVTACAITYDQIVLTQSYGLVSMRLELTRGNERVSLYHEVHVSNVP